MNSYSKFFYKGIFLLVFSISTLFTSCSDSEPFISSPKKSTVLIYAVATNSLTGNLVSDKNEMLQAASNIDLDNNNVIIFETQYKYLEDNTKIRNVNLLKLVKENENYKWQVLKDFNDGIDPLNPSRISEIIEYVTTTYKAEHNGLIFWSHSTGSQPYFPLDDKSASTDETRQISIPMEYSFGQDVTVSNEDPYYQINIDDLADAIPDNLFDYIWFDSCYMSNIESIYQLRNKCRDFVGYATEVLDAGMPYQYTLPYLVGENPDVVKAAQAFFDYYANSIATIAVTDMSKISELADFCKEIYSQTDVDGSNFMKYTRYSTGPFFDFGDYTKAIAKISGNEITEDEWNAILSSCLKYKAATRSDFAGNRIYPERYSGISTHLYKFSDSGTKGEAYYKSLDWYQYVFN